MNASGHIKTIELSQSHIDYFCSNTWAVKITWSNGAVEYRVANGEDYKYMMNSSLVIDLSMEAFVLNLPRPEAKNESV